MRRGRKEVVQEWKVLKVTSRSTVIILRDGIWENEMVQVQVLGKNSLP